MAEIEVVQRVKKRDGSTIPFNPSKIYHAIKMAVLSLGGDNFDRVDFLVGAVVRDLNRIGGEPTVEDVQDSVERVLMHNGHVHTAKAYILYRQKRKETREERSKILGGKPTYLDLSSNALILLKDRYLLTDETPEELFMRVAKNVAKIEVQYGGEAARSQRDFYQLMSQLDFLPSSTVLMNAGTPKGQLFACYALPVGDSLESIFSAVKNQAILQHSCSGTGFNLSKIRQHGATVKGREGVAVGPMGFLKLFDGVAGTVLQGGKRPGANMGILRVDHPDIMAFIEQKQRATLTNFNLSVGLTEAFMSAVEKDEEYTLKDPKSGKAVQRLHARHVFDLMILNAWKTGDPGILFLDRIQFSRSNPIAGKMEIEATSPCAEAPLYANEGTPLGSINLSKFADGDQVDLVRLKYVVHSAVRFLDNCIDANYYWLHESEIVCKQNRRMGLGVMGFADLLFKLRIQYDSAEAITLGKSIMEFVSEEADKASADLAKSRGVFPNFSQSVYRYGTPLRNASRTALSPTGSISLIADCSSATDPAFALCYSRKVLGKDMLIVNDTFKKALESRGLDSEELLGQVASVVSIQKMDSIPEDVKDVFKVQFDVTPECQVRMQGAWQEFNDGAISKTINFPSWATTRDVEEVFFLAYKLGCKGITIYRDQSQENQVISVDLDAHKNNIHDGPQEAFYCPECQTALSQKEDSLQCGNCGFSKVRV
jgi:ribonucleoside-diphosphate reductase alpha chain